MALEVETPKYDELCRLCATRTTVVLAMHLFENEGTVRQIINKIHECLPLKVSETDHLPKMICENCLYKLELFHDFRERSVRTEKLLMELYREIISNMSNVQLEHDLQHQSCVISLDNSELIMVDHQQLVDYQSLDNVSNMSLPPMDCTNIMVGNQMSNIVPESLSLNNLGNQEHSTSNLHIQESSLLASSDSQESQIHEDLSSLHNHQSYADDITFQLNLHGRNIRDVDNVMSLVHSSPQLKQLPSMKKIDYMNIKFEDSNLSDINLNVLRMSNIYRDRGQSDIETFKQEDSNSCSSLQIVGQINEIYQQTNDGSNSNLLEEVSNIKNEKSHEVISQLNGLVKGGSDKQIYNSQNENNEESLGILSQSENWFYCEICGVPYNKKEDFEAHYDSHFYKCEICLAVFTTPEILDSHKKEFHCELDRPSTDNLENKKMNDEIESEQNKADSNSSELVDDDVEDDSMNDSKPKTPSKQCQECGKTYKTNYKLTQHMRKHTGEKPFKCNSCEKTFRSKIGLAQHEAKHTGQYEFSCPTCGKGFQCRSYLTVHQRVHSSEKPFCCTTCGQNFKTKQSLLDHTNRHLGVKPFLCNICGRGFITKGVCRAHQKTHTGSDNRKYLCKVCNKMFVSKSYLRTHLRIHTGEKPFICEVCGKRFLTRVDLKVHSTLHTGEKSFSCEICGKAFARNDALRCHRRSHTGERPYSCDICGQTFTQFTPMAIHKRLHTGERPYVCEVCGKTFISKSTMMSHAKKHV